MKKNHISALILASAILSNSHVFAGPIFKKAPKTSSSNSSVKSEEIGVAAPPIGARVNSQCRNSKAEAKEEAWPKAPKCDRQNPWNVTASFLWWSSNFNTISGIDAGIQASGSAIDAKIQMRHPHAKWDPGVRLNIGRNTGYDNWDTQLTWTYFYNSARRRHSPFELHFGTSDLDASGKSKFRFRYNAGDLELGKSFFVSRHFFVRPLVGIHAIWTDISSTLKPDVPPATTPAFITSGFASKLDLEAESWGVGPRIGVNTNWGNFRGFSLLGNVSGSIVYGKHHTKAHADVTSGIAAINVHLNGGSFWQAMTTMQLQLGISYACCFHKGHNQFRANLLWENNYITEAGNVLFFDRSISMQGLTADFGFVF